MRLRHVGNFLFFLLSQRLETHLNIIMWMLCSSVVYSLRGIKCRKNFFPPCLLAGVNRKEKKSEFSGEQKWIECETCSLTSQYTRAVLQTTALLFYEVVGVSENFIEYSQDIWMLRKTHARESCVFGAGVWKVSVLARGKNFVCEIAETIHIITSVEHVGSSKKSSVIHVSHFFFIPNVFSASLVSFINITTFPLSIRCPSPWTSSLTSCGRVAGGDIMMSKEETHKKKRKSI